MTRQIHILGWVLGFSLIALCMTNVLEGAGYGTVRGGPAPAAAVCVPVPTNYGYHETAWRQWPTQFRPEQKIPRAIGHEVIPTPPGEEQLPLPKATPLPSTPPRGKEEVLPDSRLPFGPPSGGLTPILPTPQGGSSGIFQPKDGSLGPEIALPPAEPMAPLPGIPRSKSSEPAEPRDGAESGAKRLPTPPIEPKTTPKDEPAALPRSMPGGRAKESPETSRSPAGEGNILPLPLPKKKTPLDTLPKPESRPAPHEDDVPMVPRKTTATSPSSLKKDASGVLQVNWDAALYSESLGGGRLRLAEYRAEPAAAQPAAPIALGGYCPVALCETERWVQGSPKYQVVYQGQSFCVSGDAQRKRFEASPERYVPACHGNDPVIAAEEGRQAPGKVRHSAIYNGRLYLFSDAQTLDEFRQDPTRYAAR